MRRISVAVLSLLLVLGVSGIAFAGPGSVVIKTDGDITAKFGAQVRMIPTYEQNWDFGFREKTGDGRFTVHVNEAGTVGQGYIRSEDRLYFNFAKGDIWDVYFALEFDDVLSSRTGDRVRTIQGDFSAFGVERLQATIKLPWIWSRFHTGWDVYTVDLDAGSLVYTDDDPGFWLTGGVANIDWKLGYHKVVESNRRITSADRVAANNITNTGYDNDRDSYSIRVNYTLFKDTKFGLIYAFNDQKVRGSNPTSDPCGLPANNTCQNVNAHFISPIFVGTIAGFKFAAQYSHMWGDADHMLVRGDHFNIDSNAGFGDISYDMTPWFGFRFIPHVGVLWAQGDDNATDNKLEGYVGKNFQRFIPSFGGENTILADTNPAIGTILYSFLPDQRGNQNAALGVGGLAGTGRGDNPGLLLVGGGLTIDPIKNWSYRTNAYYIRYDSRTSALPLVATILAGPLGPAGTNVRLTKRDIGVEWDNEVSWWLDKNMVVKGQFSFIFPGDALKEINGIWQGDLSKKTDETAIRLALELLWNF
ncbi:MAG: hypothetical protein ACREJ6_08755 [Candidatus Methylomirabilis sp.]